MFSHAREESDANRSREQWKRHPVFYLEDGTVVLLANTTVFRVYFGLLSMHSEVFRGMADLSPYQPADAGSYDGCPLVRLTDDADDVGYFLGAIMGLYGFHPNRPTSFERAAGILRLSTKYIVPTLRQQAIDHFRRVVVIDFQKLKWIEPRPNVFGPLFPDYIQLALLFRECHLTSFLPYALCQACSEQGFTPKVINSPETYMSPREKTLALDGRQTLIHDARNIVREVVMTSAPGCACDDTLRMQWLNLACSQDWNAVDPIERWMFFELMIVSPTWREDFSYLEWPQVLTKPESIIPCIPCRRLWLDLEAKCRKKLWNKLPATFGLSSWDDLLRDEDK